MDAIYKTFLTYIPAQKILLLSLKNGEYQILNVLPYKRELPVAMQKLSIKKNTYAFISKDFVSSNNKALYVYCLKNNLDVVLLSDNSEQLKELQHLNLPCEHLESSQADSALATSEFLILDQGNFTSLTSSNPEQKTIQLWHGVGLKKMAPLKHTKYDYFVSTSDWTNNTNFKNIFDASEFLDFGYPRNDILNSQTKTTLLDFLFCDHAIHQILQETNKKVFLYAPTHRSNNFQIPLDFQDFSEELKKLDAILIVKLHPFVLAFYKDLTLNNYSNIFVHSVIGDIYPLLKYVDILISDYSSIIFDFLLLDKPLIFFVYDFNAYITTVKFLFDYDVFSPGIKVKNQSELFNGLKQIDDTYKRERKKIKDLFFTSHSKISSQLIIEHITKGYR
ncbi:MAG: CDP-glycerol glycerophosphotransferase family protein [Sulfurimonas sp.]